MDVIYAPNKINFNREKIYIFLGGSIDMGSAEDWQEKVINRFNTPEYSDVVFLNPRRKDWNSSWKQHPSNPQFKEQVIWELDCQYLANINLYYFADNSKSPITLMELGKYGEGFSTVVYCSEKFYRYGNVAIFCQKEDLQHAEDFETFIEKVKQKIDDERFDKTIE